MPAAGAVSARDIRARAQRDRILDAAQLCFAERGFHGASMAAIAETAQMSAGLIYRYFDNKSALIHGIVSRQMELLADDVSQLEFEPPVEAVIQVVEGFGKGCSGDPSTERHLDPTLMLEITAESNRDPVIGEALASFNQRIDGALSDWLAAAPEKGGFGVPAARLPSRTLVLRALLDGLHMRKARESEPDLALLRESLEDILPKLMGE
ncbi:MAG: TetR/AcrR family transcriptional regulator [Pseudomonadota bacterium]|nr:TetR/AcrR family transcriptional regulator [Pseudomonadota bacterium]